jgi:natural product biosynthesis luciferase-like monooxygenase protein
LLIEGAKFADRNGFSAVWTPERHFHRFGGLFPNPAITSAAISAITSRIQIRAGSLVLPLHNPIRAAEEWAMIDNLSNGRVGVSFASGWHAGDFVLAPENYSTRKECMFGGIETMRRLWHGDSVLQRDGNGKEVEVRILPRPVQPELPVWVTAAGSPDTFKAAGEIGANLLTHLLGQRIEDLVDKISIYRDARRRHGHPGEGHVTLMLHAFLGDDKESVREIVRGPLSQYLKDSIDLIKYSPASFPTLGARSQHGKSRNGDFELKDAAPDDLEDLVSQAFERYFETSGLFGAPRSCLDRIRQLEAAGVDEIACLIDFGVDADLVIRSLERLNELRVAAAASHAAHRERQWEEPENSVAALIEKHGVSHLQCTPSLARMLLAGGAEALGSLKQLLIGGEPLPVSLAARLREVVPGALHNMYGPTETTIWSTVHPIENAKSVAIGKPIANTRAYILDSSLQPAAPSVPGELFLGGAGVARGYLGRPELTKQRFVPDPFRAESADRLYRTGDVARYRQDGTIEFLGRKDNQVKIRGFRVELEEIEAVLVEVRGVNQAVVILEGGETADPRLVAYIAAREPYPDEPRLRGLLRTRLPEYMVPAVFLLVDEIPLTPGGKVDRAGLSRRISRSAKSRVPLVGPRTPLEKQLVEIWRQVLGLDAVGVTQNFFDIGGHSLSAMQVVSSVRDSLRVELSLRHLYESPTIAALAGVVADRPGRQPSSAPAIAPIPRVLRRRTAT